MKLKPILWTLFVVVTVPLVLRGCVAMLIRPAPLLAATEGELPPASPAPEIAPADESAKSAEAPIPEVIRPLLPTIVSVTQTYFSNGEPYLGNGEPEPKRTSQAGVVFDPRGYILTLTLLDEYDDDGRKTKVRFNDQQEYVARVVETDREFGLAILKVNVAQPLPAISLKNVPEPESRATVFAVTSQPQTKPLKGRIGSTGVNFGNDAPHHLIEGKIKVPKGEGGSLMVSDAGVPVGLWSDIGLGEPPCYAIPLKPALQFINTVMKQEEEDERKERANAVANPGRDQSVADSKRPDIAPSGDDTALAQSGDRPLPDTTLLGIDEPKTSSVRPTLPSGGKPSGNVPATTERPIDFVPEAELHLTGTYRLRNQDTPRIAEELKKRFPLLAISHDAATKTVVIREMPPKMSEVVAEAIQQLVAAQPAKPSSNSDNVKSDDNVPATPGAPIRHFRKAEVRVKEVPTLVPIKKAEVVYTESYSLKNQDAARIAEELKRIVPELEIVLDPETESLNVLRVTPKMREFVTEVIQRLSAARQEPLTPQPDKTPTPMSRSPNAQPDARHYPLVGVATLQPDGTLTVAQKRYQEAEEQARGHGLGLRSKVPPGQRTPDELQSLKNSVTTAFDARQALLRQELDNFRSRLERLAKTLETRDRDKNAIIQRRVEELLNPDLRWDASGKSNDESGSYFPATGSTESGSYFPATESTARPKASTALDPFGGSSNKKSTSMTPPTSAVAPAEREPLQTFRPDQSPAVESENVGIVSLFDVGHGQISVSLKEPGSTQVGDVLEIARPIADDQNSFTRFGRIRVIKVQPSNDSVVAVLTHSTRQLVENLWDWMEPARGDRVTRSIVDGKRPMVTKPQLFELPKELEFLSQYPRFSGLSLDMTETQFRAFLEQQQLVAQMSLPGNGELRYSIALDDEHRLTADFARNGKCQRIERISQSVRAEETPLSPAPPAANGRAKAVTKIFRLQHATMQTVAETLRRLAGEDSFSAKYATEAKGNSLVVIASPDDMLVIEAVIKRLDKAPESSSPKAAPQSSDGPRTTLPDDASASVLPKRKHHFQTSTSVETIACSADGKLIAIANGNPTFVAQTDGSRRVLDDWKPSAEILDAETGQTVVTLKLTTGEEDTLLAATERVPDFQVTALAFSPDGTMLAVGTNIGQAKLFDARTCPVAGR